MASIRREIRVPVPAEKVWDAVRDFGAVHERLVPGVLTDGRLDGDGSRVVTFATGTVVREVLVGVDDEVRRMVYAVVESPFGFAHHSSSIEVFDDAGDPNGCRLVWVSDVLPDTLAGPVGDLMDQGAAAMAKTLS
jgi:carbon monoxide dehydrogenase subunit G